MTIKVPASERFRHYGPLCGAVLGLSAIAALIVGKLPFGPDYEAAATTARSGIGTIRTEQDIDHWIMNG